ncbi:glutamate N-acetyltransferase / amino-acid N-acetyltransferase [Apostasia shenzhenica]|uniref:Glutamate N-acetyltransferase / amino-acid N-acetyltransferase n=1 Tax=Apostasia shenzhenica TaxID=1088818 RepID=A0A2I0ANP8_9ASPA|nr:glutamate N-acetyltransferase / amino-acid N-acetyltransferase [Apostasia shenzhenica]
MSPIQLKHSPASSEARVLVRDAMRSATLASSPALLPPPHPSPPATGITTDRQIAAAEVRFGGPGADSLAASAAAPRVLCCEQIDGKRWNYVVEPNGPRNSGRGDYLRTVSLQSPVAPIEELVSFIRSYVVPEGFPDSVTPSYVPYMSWRALKHFFGGAMGVFTTRTLLHSLGASKSSATSGAVAINWILKDGAGRVGKLLYSRQGKKFDYDLKQLRFAGDLLMEFGAGLELATAAVPHLFLPLACIANVAKVVLLSATVHLTNVGAVTSTSTRTPIYKAYAKGENIGDVTAKGECVSNVADLLGTGLSILVSKRNPSLVSSFAFLSCGYVLSSYQEVKSVVLHTMNRARFAVAVNSFLKTGSVPSLKEGNAKENIFSFPWSKQLSVVLGSKFGDAFQDPASFLAIDPLFEKEKYIVTYNPSKGNIYALLKEKAKSDDILKAAFHAHVLQHFIHTSSAMRSSRQHTQSNLNDRLSNHLLPTSIDIEAHVAESCKAVSFLYGDFKRKSADEGWIMSESLLNPGRARFLRHSSSAAVSHVFPTEFLDLGASPKSLWED